MDLARTKVMEAEMDAERESEAGRRLRSEGMAGESESNVSASA